jgi:hypothetical protein
MSAEGPSRGRLHEWGEAKARSARPRVRAAADVEVIRISRKRKEAARHCAPVGVRP